MDNLTPVGIKHNISPDPFGMITVGRSWEVGSEYRYGFGGKEQDNEISGNGNEYDFGNRIYNSRIGRWFKPDKLEALAPNWSPYRFGLNNPIRYSDFQGNFEIDEATAAKYPDLKPALLNLLTELQKPENDAKVTQIVALAELGSKEELFEILTDGKGPKLKVADLTDYTEKVIISQDPQGTNSEKEEKVTYESKVTETGRELGASIPVMGLTTTDGYRIEIDGTQVFTVTNQEIYIDDAIAASLDDLFTKKGEIQSETILKLFNGVILHEIGHYGDEQDGIGNSAQGAGDEVGDAVEIIFQGEIVKGVTILPKYEPEN